MLGAFGGGHRHGHENDPMTAEDRHLLLLKKKMGVYWPSRQLLLLQKKTGLDWPSLFRFLFREGRRRLEEVFQALDLFDAIDQAEREGGGKASHRCSRVDSLPAPAIGRY